MAIKLEDGTQLEQNLYTHQRKKYVPGEKHGFRYRGRLIIKDQTSKVVMKSLGHWIKEDVTDFTAEEANSIARALNEQQGLTITTTSTKIQRKSLRFYGELFIDQMKARKPDSLSKKKFQTNNCYVRKFCKQLNHISPHKLTFNDVENWWWGTGDFTAEVFEKTAGSQGNQKSILKQFFGYLRTNKIVSRDEFLDNPFNNRDGDTPIGLKEAEEKQTMRLSLDQFYAVRETAFNNGSFHVVDAMDIGLFTGMRVGDICSLRYDKHLVDNQIKTHFSKTGNESGEETVHIIIPLDKHVLVKEVIERSQETRLSVLLQQSQKPAPHIIHKKYRNYCLEGKEHHAQVLATHMTREFARCRALAITADSGLPKAHRVFEPLPDGKRRPGFHQIRSLFARLRLQAGIDRKLTQVAMGHSGEDMTAVYDSTGYEVDWTEMPAPMTPDIIKQGLMQHG